MNELPQIKSILESLEPAAIIANPIRMEVTPLEEQAPEPIPTREYIGIPILVSLTNGRAR